eukprot:6188814-Pleurochrysis_carterae.AAC.1
MRLPGTSQGHACITISAQDPRGLYLNTESLRAVALAPQKLLTLVTILLGVRCSERGVAGQLQIQPFRESERTHTHTPSA